MLPLLLVPLCALLACTQSKKENDITISCAISLKNTVERLGSAFTAHYPSYTLRYNFGASGQLRTQIEYGAPVDLFLSAGQQEMDLLAQEGRIVPSSRLNFTGNQLVLITPRSQRQITSLETLRHARGKVAIGNPKSVPAGRYAKAVFVRAKLYDHLKARLVFGEHVRQVLDWVQREEVAAGVVFRSDLHTRGTTVRLVVPLKTPHPIRYPAAQVAQSQNPQGAELFLSFLKTPEAQAILTASGFRGE